MILDFASVNTASALIRTDDIQVHLFNPKYEQVLYIWPPPYFLVCGRRYLKAQLFKY